MVWMFHYALAINQLLDIYVHFSSVQLLSHVQLFATPWTAACQASLSITNSWSLLKLMSIELVMPSNHLILCYPLLLPLSTFPSILIPALCIRWPVREYLILKNPICCFLFLKGPLFLISSWKTGTSRAAHSSQDWGHEAECIHGFLSVAFYFSVKLLSHVPISNTWTVFWPCDDCYSPSYCCYGPMTIVIPLVTVVMCLALVFFTQLYYSA